MSGGSAQGILSRTQFLIEFSIMVLIVIPTINLDFAGRALDDFGAPGKPSTHHGLRWLTWRPLYR
jgi:hypothetical protein